MTLSTTLDGIRQPQYTGENRCVPCTAVNLAIAAAVSLVLGVASIPLMVASFLLFAGVIYVRGYLVPGTPTLTKRYLPDRVLRWFDKEPARATVPFDEDDGVDPEAALLAAGALEPCADEDDLCLSAAFEAEWTDEIRRLDGSAAERRLAALLGVGADRVGVVGGDGWVVAAVDGVDVGRWESRAALVADVAADAVLADRVANWAALPLDQRSALARGLRINLERCPDCGGDVALGTETASSCCRSWDVFVARCADCDARLFEVDADAVDAAA